jgi:molybdate transport system permease protein
MSWARGLGEFGATLIFAGNAPGRTQTMPLAIFSNFAATEQRALVVAVVLLLVSFGFLGILQFLQREPLAH